jgi:ANTAR domain
VSGAPGIADKTGEADEAARLAVTVAQLEHALAARVRVEQAIGVLAERHRLRPREAFDLLRRVSRSRGARVTELAQDVVASTANPLLTLPDELSRARPEPRQRNRSLRRGGGGRHAL